MSVEDTIHGFIDSVNNRDFDKMRGLLHPEYTYTGGDGSTMQGPDAGVAVVQMFVGAMSDAKITIDKIHVAGDTAIVEFTGAGTHDGDFQGIAPTGKKVTMPVCDVLVVRDGKIYAEREYMDMAHLMQQIGALPAPATA